MPQGVALGYNVQAFQAEYESIFDRFNASINLLEYHMKTRSEIFAEVLKLSVDDRYILWHQLDMHLEKLREEYEINGGFATPELAKAWSEEVTRRLDSYLNGNSRAINAETSLQDIRNSLTAYHEKKLQVERDEE